MKGSICLHSQVYTDETNSFYFYIKDRHTGTLSKHSPTDLISNKKIMALLPGKHRIRIACIAGFEWAQQNETKIAELKLIKQNEAKIDDKDKKDAPKDCNKYIQNHKIS